MMPLKMPKMPEINFAVAVAAAFALVLVLVRSAVIEIVVAVGMLAVIYFVTSKPSPKNGGDLGDG